MARRREDDERRARVRVIGAAAAVAVGVLLAGQALLALHADSSTPTAFGSFSQAPSTASPRSAPGTSGASHRARTAQPALLAPAREGLPESPVLTWPITLRIAALGVTATVERVATRHGLLGVPDDVSHVGWFTGSALPGSPTGATVIDGHVDSAAEGEGALFHLTDLRAGQRITLTTRGGHDVTYQVYARRIYSKTHPLPAALFTTTGASRLVLITCGGPFNTDERSYLDNIAVFATPITTAS